MPDRNEDLPLAVEIQQTEDQLHIYDGLATAMRDPRLVLDLVLEADDVDDALAVLRARLGLDEVQAHAVVDLQFRRATKLDRRKLEGRRQEVGSHLEFLRQLDAETPE